MSKTVGTDLKKKYYITLKHVEPFFSVSRHKLDKYEYIYIKIIIDRVTFVNYLHNSFNHFSIIFFI